jgi:hypothetical protein
MKRYADEWIESFEDARETPAETKRELEENYRRARLAIEEATALGAFVISTEAAAGLAKLQADMNRARAQEDLYDLAVIESKALEQSLEEIRKLAKQDLGVASTVIAIKR